MNDNPLADLETSPVPPLADPALVRARGEQRRRRAAAAVGSAAVLLMVALAGTATTLVSAGPAGDTLRPAAPAVSAEPAPSADPATTPTPEQDPASTPTVVSTASTLTSIPSEIPNEISEPSTRPTLGPVAVRSAQPPPAPSVRPTAAPSAMPPAVPTPASPSPQASRQPSVVVRAASITGSNFFTYTVRGFDPTSELNLRITDETGTVLERRTFPPGDAEDRGSGTWGPPPGLDYPQGQVLTVAISDTADTETDTWEWR